MKKLVILVLALFASVCSQVAFAQQDTTSANVMDPKAAIYYNKGIEALKAEKYDDALASFDSSLQVSPDYRTHALRAQALIKLGKQAEAKDAFKASIALKPDYDIAYNGLANLHLAMKEYDDAVANYKKVLEVSQNDALKKNAQESMDFVTNAEAIELYNTGNDLYKAEKYQEAIASYDKSLAISKDYKTYYQKALALSKLEKNKEAVTEFQNSIAANDTFDMAYIALGGLQTKMKDYDGALASYQKAMQVSTNDKIKENAKDGLKVTYFILGNNSFRAKKYDAAEEQLNKAIELEPYDQAYLQLGQVYTAKKQYDKAEDAFTKTAENKKTVTDGAIAYYKGQMYKAKGDMKSAAASFQAATTDPKFKKFAQSELDFMKAKAAQDKKK